MTIAFDYAIAALLAFDGLWFEGAWDGGAFSTLHGEWVALADTLPDHRTYRLVAPFTTGSHTLQVRACVPSGCGATFSFAVSPAAPTGLQVVR